MYKKVIKGLSYMEYRVLGRTGIRVSAVGIGGEGFENKIYKDCEAIIDCAMNEGINFIDIYNSNWKSEAM